MIQYIYFVKCPECEDEPFDFFNDAKEYALGCLSKKPIITQIEVDRNDFGECIDSSDLGTIWSWEDMVKDTEEEPLSTFSKYETVGVDLDNDPEFAALDNSLDAVPDNFRRPVPADMSIKDLVEEMEENEDEVECTWCNELFDKSECRKEVDLGWLCGRCEAAIKSRGEPLTFQENSYWDFLDEEAELTEAANRETVELTYDNLTITIPGPKRAADDWDEVEHTDSFTLTVDKDEVATVIWENFITDEDVADVAGGLDALEDDVAWEKFLESHFDILFNKYYNELLAFFREDAITAFENSYSWGDYQADQEFKSFDESVTKSVLEELEDSETYRDRLDLCPECGDNSFDHETGICISCGFN